jgi:hypothetical protein
MRFSRQLSSPNIPRKGLGEDLETRVLGTQKERWAKDPDHCIREAAFVRC